MRKRVQHQMSFESLDFQKLVFASKTLVLETKAYSRENFQTFYFFLIDKHDFL